MFNWVQVHTPTAVHSGFGNVVPDHFFNPKKEGEKPKSSSSAKSCRICTCSFAWGILARLLTYLRKIYSEGFTWCGTRQLQWAWSQLNCLAENLCSITTCFGVLHPKSLMLPSKNYLVFCLSNQPKYVVLCWQNNGRNPKLFHLFYLFFQDAFECRTMKHLYHLYFLLPSWYMYIKHFSKPVSKTATSFNWSRWTAATFCSSLREKTLKCLLTGFYFKNSPSITNHGMCQWWQLLQATKRAWTQYWSAVVKVMTHSSPFNQWEFSFSGIHFLPHPT